jgi:hypothetical protein
VVLIGAIGTGKTTIVNALPEEIRLLSNMELRWLLKGSHMRSAEPSDLDSSQEQQPGPLAPIPEAFPPPSEPEYLANTVQGAGENLIAIARCKLVTEYLILS